MNDLYAKIEHSHAAISVLCPFEDHMLEQLKDCYRIALTWSSNPIGENALTISETEVVLEDSLTIASWPLCNFHAWQGL